MITLSWPTNPCFIFTLGSRSSGELTGMMKSRLQHLIIPFLILSLSSLAEPYAHVYPTDLLSPSTQVPSVQRTSTKTLFIPKSEQLEKSSNSTLTKETKSKSRTTPPMHVFRRTNSRANFSNIKNIVSLSSSNRGQVKNIASLRRSNQSQSKGKFNFSSQRTNKPNEQSDSKRTRKPTMLKGVPVNLVQNLKQETNNSTSNRKQNSRKTLSKFVLKRTLHTGGKTFSRNNIITSDLFSVNRTNILDHNSFEVDGVKNPELLSELREIIRHQRQIRFKSSYQDLPVSILTATNDIIGQKLNNDMAYFIQVDVEAPAVAKALATLPGGSRTYFPPQSSQPAPISFKHYDGTRTQIKDKNTKSKLIKFHPDSSSSSQNLTTIRKGIRLTSKTSSTKVDRPFRFPNKSFIPLSSHSSSPPSPNPLQPKTQTPATWLTPPDRQNTNTNRFDNALSNILRTPKSFQNPSQPLTQAPVTWLTTPDRSGTNTNRFNIALSNIRVTPKSFQPYTPQTKHLNKTQISSHSSVTTSSSKLFKSSSSPPIYVTAPPSNVNNPMFNPNRITYPSSHFLNKIKPKNYKNEVYTLAPLSLQFVKSSAAFGSTKKLDTQSNNKKPVLKSPVSPQKSQNNSIMRHKQFMATIKPIVNVQSFSQPNTNRFQPSRFSTKPGDMELASQFPFNDGKTRKPSSFRRTDGSLSGPIRGKAGIDYPTYQTIPKTNFDCSSKPYEGYFADQEAECQVFHVCWGGNQPRHASFLCPIGTLFNQRYLVCDWWNHVNCDLTKEYEDAGSSPWDAQGNPRPRANAI